MPTIQADSLEQFATALLEAGGIQKEEAVLVARSLVSANIRGYASHGVMRIPFYLDMLAKGEVVTGAELTIQHETASNIVADANWGFGQTQMHRLTERLLEKARVGGVAIGTVTRSSHIGRLGEYCERVAEQEMISMIMANTNGSTRRIAPPGGKEPRLGTNPLAIGVPNGSEPLVLDFSTGATAEGRVRVKHIAGESCPEGWLIDNEGRPTCDPHTLYTDPPGAILPMGGMQAYKGFGLGLMVEVFAGALSGGLCAREKPLTQKANCVFMMVLDPAHFGGRQHFAKEIADMAEFIRGCPRAEGVDEILLPGDPERKLVAERSTDGIFLDEENWAALTKQADLLHVSVPQ